jgi:peptidyl-prolyl cis-trans isomerase C
LDLLPPSKDGFLVRTSPARLTRLLAPLAVLALLLAACGPGGSPNVAATVNGEEIAIAEVEERYATVRENPQFAEQLEADVDGQLAEQVQARILSDLIESIIVRQGADELGVSVTDEEVTTRREELIEEVGGQETFDELVEESGLTLEQIDEQVRDIAVREAVQRELTADLEVTDEDVEAFFEANREARYDTAEARHILVETEEEADDIIERIEDGEDFADIAQEESIDTGSGAQGGELGEFGRGQMVPEFEEAVFTAEIGELVGPIETQFGFHIIEVTERNAPELEEVEEDIREELSQGQQGELVQSWLAEQRREAEVEVNPRFGEWDPERGEVVTADPLGDTAPGPGAGGEQEMELEPVEP